MILKPEDALLAEAVFQRRSVRSFQLKKPDERAVAALRSEISYATSRDAAIHFQLFLNDPSHFEGFTAGYGMFRNARHYVACVVDTSYEDCMQRAGYWAEKVALRAVSKGLGTCFVSGTYKSDSVAAQLRVTWRIPFILLVGYESDRRNTLMARMMKGLAGSARRPSAASVLSSDSMSYEEVLKQWPELQKPLEAVAAAPSSMNRHPARICIQPGDTPDMPRITAKVNKEYAQSDIDLGIALCNWQIVAGGEWEYGPEPLWLD